MKACVKRSSWSIARLTFGGSLVRNARFGMFWRLAQLTFAGSLVRNAHFGDLQCSCFQEVWDEACFDEGLRETRLLEHCTAHFWRKSRTKRSFWRLAQLTFAGSLVRNAHFGDAQCSCLKAVWDDALVLMKACVKRSSWSIARLTLGGSLVRNARSGDLRGSLFWRKSRTKRSFWRFARLTILEEVSYETLVLETCAAHFWRKSRRKRSFWRLARLSFGGSLVRSSRSGDLRGSGLEEASYETLVLETCAAHFWRKSRTKRSFWRLARLSFGGSLGRSARSGDLRGEVSYEALVLETCAAQVWRKPRMKRSFWRLARLTFGGSLGRSARSGDLRGSVLEEVSYEALVLETCAARFWRKLRMKRSFWRLARLTFGGSLGRSACSGDLRGSVLEEVSYEALVLETCAARFWRKSRTKRSFWRLARSL